ncbi:hypothetical protein PUN4_330150 [Paraburkholderia unamae]|nr:hypothetical protein PUN4_330150 [Paraburkholderia unamae]
MPARSTAPQVVEFLSLVKETSSQTLPDIELCE